MFHFPIYYLTIDKNILFINKLTFNISCSIGFGRRRSKWPILGRWIHFFLSNCGVQMYFSMWGTSLVSRGFYSRGVHLGFFSYTNIFGSLFSAISPIHNKSSVNAEIKFHLIISLTYMYKKYLYICLLKSF